MASHMLTPSAPSTTCRKGMGDMMITVREGSHFVIIHAGRVIDEKIPDRESAESWADRNIDDQMFDEPNTFSPPLKYRDAPLMRVVGIDPEPR